MTDKAAIEEAEGRGVLYAVVGFAVLGALLFALNVAMTVFDLKRGNERLQNGIERIQDKLDKLSIDSYKWQK